MPIPPAQHLTQVRQLDLFGQPAVPIPVINPDGVSVKGCRHIYAPPGRAGEYAVLACNPYVGCGHACSYPCYVPDYTHQPRAEFNAGAILKPNFIANLRADAEKY